MATKIQQHFAVEITPQSPLVFAERKPGAQFRESLPYVPGSTIFGAIGRYLSEEQRFDENLLRHIHCHNAYPAHLGDDWVRPLPLTALQPKAERTHSITDALVARVCYAYQQPVALIYLPTDKDGRPWEFPGWGFYRLKANKIAERRVTQRVLTRVAINRQRGTAEDQRLYSPLVLVEASYQRKNQEKKQENEQEKKQENAQENKQEYRPTRFLGSVTVLSNDTTNVPALLEQAGCKSVNELLGKIRYLGGRQSTGMGAVSLTAHSQEAEPAAAILDRVTRLTQRFQTQAVLYQQLGGAAWDITERTIFTVNLLSDAILLEHGWLPTQELSPWMLKELTGIEATLLRSFTHTQTVGGWAVLWQRHKLTQFAVSMGSLYVFQATQPLTAAEGNALAQLQLRGIGERRQEGYGQVRICDEFHVPEQAGNQWEIDDDE